MQVGRGGFASRQCLTSFLPLRTNACLPPTLTLLMGLELPTLSSKSALVSLVGHPPPQSFSRLDWLTCRKYPPSSLASQLASSASVVHKQCQRRLFGILFGIDLLLASELCLLTWN